MEVQGKIKKIFETKEYGSNGFRKREVVVTTQEQYPQHLLVEFTQDRTELLNNYREGQTVKIGINLRGREWINPEGKAVYFNSINGWRIEALETQAPSGNMPPPPTEDFEPVSGPDFGSDADEEDDLPF